MTQSTDYKRGYGKGYYTGRGERSVIEQRHQDELRLVAQRAERAEVGAGLGHCDGCRHWERPQACAWGYCNVTKQPGTPWGCWTQGEDTKTHASVRISTSPKFGCVLFAARDEALQELGNG